MFDEKRRGGVPIDRWREDVTLTQHATDPAELSDLFLGLDPLSDDPDGPA